MLRELYQQPISLAMTFNGLPSFERYKCKTISSLLYDCFGHNMTTIEHYCIQSSCLYWSDVIFTLSEKLNFVFSTIFNQHLNIKHNRKQQE